MFQCLLFFNQLATDENAVLVTEQEGKKDEEIKEKISRTFLQIRKGHLQNDLLPLALVK